MSSWHTSQLTYAFGIGGMMSFYGVVSVIVYFLPASTASYNEKIVIIALVLLTLPFALLIMFIASRRAKKRAAAAEAAPQPDAAASAAAASPTAARTAPVGAYPAIDEGIQEVVGFLKSSNLGADGKDSLYSLPWYLVAGPSRSGKSSLVISSDLDLKTLPSQRESEQRMIRPTSGVDWRVTSEGIFIDTAGRYQAEGADADEWNALLEAIRRARPARPIDGYILVVDGDRVNKEDEQHSDQIAKVLRTRLDEAMQRLKVRFPVYVVFSHADGFEGFSDSFSASKNEGREFVWGSTIPLEKSENAQAQFDPEFELLRDSAMKRRILRLSAPFPPVRQLKIFNFPLHFGSARRKLGAFITTLFRPNPFSENPLLRGFYFTSTAAARGGQNAPATIARSYFTTRLIRDVFLRDRDLVRAFQGQKQRGPILAWLTTFLALGIIGILLVLAGVSLYNNKKMLDEAQARGEKVIAITRTDAYKDPAKADERSIRTEVGATEDLRELLVKMDEYERVRPPWFMRLGLYSGNTVFRKHLLPVYMAVIENRYKASAIRRMQADLKKFSTSPDIVNPASLTPEEEKRLDTNYDLLKAYLMLTGPYKEKADPTTIANVLKDYWTADDKIPQDLRPTALAQLDFWAKQVDRDDADYSFPRIQADDGLVAAARKKLQAFPAVYRYYKARVTEISKTVDDKIGPQTVEGILTRNGAGPRFIDGTYQVPGAFTRSGLKLMRTAIDEANDKLSEGDWVMGEPGNKQVTRTTTDSKLIEDRYYRDYVDNWRAFVKGTNVKAFKDKDSATAALQAFASENSPMKILLVEIAKNTNLSARPDSEGWWDWIKSFFTSQTADGDGNTPPEKAFKPLFAFVGKKSDKDKAPVDNYGSELQRVSQKFSPLSADKLRTVAEDLANGKDDTLRLQSSEGAIDGMLGTFADTSASQELAVLIKEPLGNLRALLGGDAQAQLKKAWAEQILPAAKDIEKGYPFQDGSTEADLTKLSAFLNPVDGKLSVFYNDKLKKYFEEANGQLKVKADSEVKFSDEFVAYLNNAFALRKALFGTSQTPKFEYEFSFKPSKDAIIEVTIDGQKLTSEGTASIKGTFPAPTSTETGVILSSGASGPTTTTGANSNATAPTTDSGGNQRFPGQWGLFRFVDAGKPSKQPGGEYSLSYSVGGHGVSAQIKPSGGDLFDKNIFRQVSAPQNLLK